MVNYLWVNPFNRKDESNHLNLLKNNMLFQTLDQRELRFINKMIHERTYHKDDVIFQQGSLGTGMYVIIRGNVGMFIRDNKSKDQNTDPTHVARLTKEDFFGELCLVEEDSRRTATAIAVEDTLLAGFFRPDLVEILDRNPTMGSKITFQLAKILAHRLRSTTNRITQLKKELQVFVDIQK